MLVVSVWNNIKFKETTEICFFFCIYLDDIDSFQNGVDTIYNGCVTYGSTPTASTPSSIVTAISNIYTNRYNAGYNSGYGTGSAKELKFVTGFENCDYTGNVRGTHQWTSNNNYDILYVIQGGAGYATNTTYTNITLTSSTASYILIRAQDSHGYYSLGATIWKVINIKSGDIISLVNAGQYACIILSLS